MEKYKELSDLEQWERKNIDIDPLKVMGACAGIYAVIYIIAEIIQEVFKVFI